MTAFAVALVWRCSPLWLTALMGKGAAKEGFKLADAAALGMAACVVLIVTAEVSIGSS